MNFLDTLITNGELRNTALVPDATRTAPDQNDFLRLLTAQLTNQDPLQPSDPTAFIEQLATFSSLEALNNINGGLDELSVAQASVVSATAVDFAGRIATVATDKVELPEEGSMALGAYSQRAGTVRVEIKDSAGQVVREIDLGPQEAGIVQFEWDGLDNEGERAAAGTYTLSVETEVDGETYAATALVRGRVDSVTFERGFAELRIFGHKYSLADILEIG